MIASSKLEAAFQDAISHQRAGRPSEAERLYRIILQARPDVPDVYNNLGIALKDQGKLEEATAVFRQASAALPDNPTVHNNLGKILSMQGKWEEAEGSYRRALALNPDMVDALKNLGLVIVENGHFAESFPWFRRHAKLAYGRTASANPIPQHKVQHDQEQRDYINGEGCVGMRPSTGFHLEEGGRMPGRAVNSDLSNGGIAARWLTSSPQIAVIDNLLTDEALDKLRQFCWRSTIWESPHSKGYLRAMPEHGFSCQLLAQIDEELRGTYPELLSHQPLLRWWAFKYDSRLTGVNVHADFAAVNVNLWIAPEEANLDPESGGLIVWDVPAPLEWDFDQYNRGGVQAIRDFLVKAGARSITVPHRANRAVIFDSDLFHETDRIAFKEGYVNRRINITMLYGRRDRTAKPILKS